ncbi:hypothetical protein OKW40_002581 [Paraburkholderia sp. RAU6.4a]
MNFTASMAILRGVADVLLLRLTDGRVLGLQRADDFGGVVDRQRGLRDEGDPLRIGELQCLHILDVLDQMHALGRLAHRAFDFRVALVADHHDVETVLAHLRDFDMHLGHERTGGVVHPQPARLGLRAHGLRHAMRAEDHRVARRHFVQVLDEDRSLLAQVFDHIGVMDDFVTHVDRRAIQLDGPLDDLDRPVDAGAEPAWLGQQDLRFGKSRIRDAHVYRIPMIFTSNASAWPASG